MLIALDAAGGDYAPHEIIKGAIEARRLNDLNIALVGHTPAIRMIERKLIKKNLFKIFDAPDVIDFKENPVQAVRKKPNSSIVVGTKLVKDNIASCFISAGNTGAILAAAYLYLNKVKQIERPALCGIINVNPFKPVLLIDAGANVDCKPNYLLHFAHLGNVFAKNILKIEEPKIALINVGEEEIKGNALYKETFQLLKNGNFNFIGNIEGHEILTGKADIIVADGFTGNVLLKTMEGFGELFQEIIKPEIAPAILQNLHGVALAHYATMVNKVKQMDYQEYGGACLLGVCGNIIVAHGRSQAKAIKNALLLAYEVSKMNLWKIIQNI